MRLDGCDLQKQERGSGRREWAADGKQPLTKVQGTARMGCVLGVV